MKIPWTDTRWAILKPNGHVHADFEGFVMLWKKKRQARLAIALLELNPESKPLRVLVAVQLA